MKAPHQLLFGLDQIEGRSVEFGGGRDDKDDEGDEGYLVLDVDLPTGRAEIRIIHQED